MKKISMIILGGILSTTCFAQDITSKIVVAKGDHIKMKSDMNISNTMSMGDGDPTESTTVLNAYYDLEVKDMHDTVIVVSQTLKTMKIDFDGFGQKMKYDSESKEKQDNPLANSVAEKIGVPEEYKINLSGKLIEDKNASDKTNDTKKGGGMMRMMSMGGSSVVETAFLIIPQDAVAKGGWETNTMKDQLNIRKKYTIAAMMGPMATINVQSQTKGDISMNRGGMPAVTNVNTLTEEMIVVNVITGKVQMQTVNMTNNNKTMMGDKESPSTGKTTINYTFE